MREVEVKCRVANVESITKLLHNHGIVLSDPVTQDDEIFIPKGQTLPAGPGINVLRIRTQGNKTLLTLKYVVSDSLDKAEHELEISDATVMRQIIVDLGFFEAARVRKTRQKAQLGEAVELCLDTVEQLGTFIEVEKLVSGDNVTGVQEELLQILADLGIDTSQRVRVGYDILLIQERKQSSQ